MNAQALEIKSLEKQLAAYTGEDVESVSSVKSTSKLVPAKSQSQLSLAGNGRSSRLRKSSVLDIRRDARNESEVLQSQEDLHRVGRSSGRATNIGGGVKKLVGKSKDASPASKY